MHKTCGAILAVAGALVTGGCHHAGGGLARVDDQKQPFNRWTMQSIDDESISNAIVAQHTLYPYHFLASSAELNQLGERDVRVLADHMAKHPGELNVRRAGESKDLYEARVQAVTKLLAQFGVPAPSIKITDGLPGGDGTTSERAVLVLQRTYQSTPLTTDAGSSFGASGAGGGESAHGAAQGGTR